MLAPRRTLPAPLLYGLIAAQTLWFAVLFAPLLARSLDWVAATWGLETISLLALLNAVFGLGVIGLVTRTIWDTRMLLYISLTLFNAGALIAHVFTPDAALVPRFFTDTNLAAAGYLIVVCLSAWVLATLISVLLVRPRETTAVAAQVSKLRFIGLLFLAIGTVPAVLELREAVQVVATGGYLALYQQDVTVGASNWRAVAGVFFVPGLLFLLGSGTLLKRGLTLVVLAMLAYVATKLSLGSRSPAIMPLIALGFVWHYRIRPIPARLTIGLGAAIFLVLLPAITVLRQEDTAVSLSPIALFDAFFSLQNPLLATLFDAGGTIMPTAYSLIYIPGARELGHGSSYLTSLWTILPSTGGLNPAIAGDNVYAQWLARAVDPGVASNGGGYGFSPIAEAYANFGVVGGVMGFFVIALFVQGLLARFSNWKNAAHVVFSGVILSVLLLWARGEAVSFVRPVAWFVLIPALYLLIQTHRQNALDARYRERLLNAAD